jgi:hypothetical protein
MTYVGKVGEQVLPKTSCFFSLCCDVYWYDVRGGSALDQILGRRIELFHVTCAYY